jgi:5-methylcytosine-specific restriction endonuclease McrA
MTRSPNTDRNGRNFTNETILAVWNKGQIVSGYDPSLVRKDVCGAWIHWNKYGVTVDYGNGWEIDHKKPVAKGGGDEIDNLQPLQWQNNRKKGDDFPASNFCAVSAFS